MLGFPRLTLVVGLLLATSGTSCLEMFTTSPTSPSSETSSYEGSWASVAASTAPQTCTNFHWTMTDVTLTSVTGSWTATCHGNVDVAGTASGTLDTTKLTWAATGTGTVLDVGSCPVALTGTATLANNQLRIPYTGITCLGPVAGTEILRK
ncbi:MAG: hypothetical protein HQ485_01055 [Acidobacteria bacterium]|jgi:hypothetical protein|nr:hypothetical protein [Acidobacteriota bacterium]